MSESPAAAAHDAGGKYSGVLHILVAFDWGEEVDLARAKELSPSIPQELPRRHRTPASINYRPTPLQFDLSPLSFDFPKIGPIQAVVELTMFDFGAVGVEARFPFTLPPKDLSRWAASLSSPEAIVQTLRKHVAQLFERVRPAIHRPHWSDLTEEYLVFQFSPDGGIPSPDELLRTHGPWITNLLRLEETSWNEGEITEALRLRLRYNARDLFIPDWSAALLIDKDCEETIRTIEFTNVQLLEFRHIDDRLDDRLEQAYRFLHPLTKSWLPFWQTNARSLRELGEIKIESNSMYERAGSALKLMGDQYLARVYRLVGERFHLKDWEQSIRSTLNTVESAYQTVSDQGAHYRTEVLELIIIMLILFEIVMTFVR